MKPVGLRQGCIPELLPEKSQEVPNSGKLMVAVVTVTFRALWGAYEQRALSMQNRRRASVRSRIILLGVIALVGAGLPALPAAADEATVPAPSAAPRDMPMDSSVAPTDRGRLQSFLQPALVRSSTVRHDSQGIRRNLHYLAKLISGCARGHFSALFGGRLEQKGDCICVTNGKPWLVLV